MKTKIYVNKFILTTLLLCIAVVVLSCSKDDDSSNTGVNPLSAYLIATNFNQNTLSISNYPDHELGLAFKPTVNGKINAIVVKLPDTRTGLRVTVWNKATNSVIRTELMDITSSGVEFIKKITPINLTANNEYVISFNTTDWYLHEKLDTSSATYPVTVGDLVITGHAYLVGPNQNMPTNYFTESYNGDLSFKFQKN